MKRKGFLAVIGAAALTVVMAACVYDGAAGDGYVGVTTLPAVVDVDSPEFLVSNEGGVIVAGTTRENSRPQNSRPTNDEYQGWTSNLDVVMAFTFNADGSIASFTVINNGHGVDGIGTCGRWNPESTNDGDIYPFLNRLMAEGVVFPVADVAEVVGTGRATYSRSAVIYIANYAAGLR